ncbi:KTSC domain-containing protein [Stenotrophomonas sp. C3(2023)]|uniref:KTSC domain-containing protein n=1 Tax=Stenotrophomonas sp. C3(2023) TaxID=3080277 RepID=UPI00293C42FE|nr:KTSC domain-containing protein [Stenotrophomonas sp. C3(2023)]MDV3469049.1 KTSC domain-containing protein [Stenotrophomonas sp. C3(2023)]
MAPRIELQDVESNQIHSIGHDPKTNTLAICFPSRKGGQLGPGSLYHYSNFTAEDFAAFQAAESKGKHFSAHIKAHPEKYLYVKIELPAQAA